MKHILITGASSGIGKELSRRLAEPGRALLLTGRNEESLRTLQRELSQKGQVDYCVCDLSQSAQRLDLEAKIEKGSFDCIINNAGFGLYGEALALDLSEQLAMVEVNVRALMSISIVGARAMIRASLRGTIVNIASTASLLPMPNMSVYGATKAFVASFSEALDYELRPKGVRVLTSYPGMVASDFAKRASKRETFSDEERGHAPFMTPGQAAEEIIWQIARQKTRHVFDTKTRWMMRLVTLLPSALQKKIVYESIKARRNNEI